MEQIKNPVIKVKGQLERREYEDIKDLEKYCVEKDNVTLKLELNYKWNTHRDKSENLNEFMFYDGDVLIGYIGICQFREGPLEVNGMVHPDYRRKGVFSRLFSLVKEEWYKRKSQEMLLLSDHNSPSGAEFIRNIGAQYENAEYEMFLEGKSEKGPPIDRVRLREATNKDAEEIARQDAIYFPVESEKKDPILPEEEAKRGVDIYLAEIDNVIIGKVHLEIHDGIGGIYGLGVLPEYRRKGHGRAILLKAVEQLKKKKVNKVMLQVVVKNNTALNLYKSCGFEITSTMDYYKLTKDMSI